MLDALKEGIDSEILGIKGGLEGRGGGGALLGTYGSMVLAVCHSGSIMQVSLSRGTMVKKMEQWIVTADIR